MLRLKDISSINVSSSKVTMTIKNKWLTIIYFPMENTCVENPRMSTKSKYIEKI